MTMLKNRAAKGWTHHSRVKKSGKTKFEGHVYKPDPPLVEKDEEKQQDYAQITEILGPGSCEVLVNDGTYAIAHYTVEFQTDSYGCFYPLYPKEFVLIQFKNPNEADVIGRYDDCDVWKLFRKGELDANFRMPPRYWSWW